MFIYILVYKKKNNWLKAKQKASQNLVWNVDRENRSVMMNTSEHRTETAGRAGDRILVLQLTHTQYPGTVYSYTAACPYPVPRYIPVPQLIPAQDPGIFLYCSLPPQYPGIFLYCSLPPQFPGIFLYCSLLPQYPGIFLYCSLPPQFPGIFLYHS